MLNNPSKRSAPPIIFGTEGLGKRPPQAIDSEERVLAACLNGHYDTVATYITSPDVFYKEVHMRIFDAFIKIKAEGKEITPYQIKRTTTVMGTFELLGGMLAISELTEVPFFVGDIINECLHIIETSIARNTIAVCSDITKDLFDDTKMDVFNAIKKIEDLGIDVNNKISGLKTFSFEQERNNVIEKSIKRFNGELEDYIKIGIRSVDEIIGGLVESGLTIIGARSGVGKTIAAIQISYNVSFLHKIPTAFFSLEMSTEQVLNRFLSNHTRTSNKELREGFYGNKEKLNSYINNCKLFNPENLDIYHTYRNLDMIISKAKELIKSKGVKLIIVDYVQLITTNAKSSVREQEVAYISRSFKELGLSTGCHIILLAQLNRDSDKRGGDKTPKVSDLRESSSLEFDADTVILLHRPYYYNNDPADEFKLNWIVAKNRSGPTGSTELFCDIKYNLILNSDRELSYEVSAPKVINHHQALAKLTAFNDQLDGADTIPF